jgi:cytochrome c2
MSVQRAPLSILSAIFLAAVSAAVATAETEGGQQVFVEAKCNQCHAVASAGIVATTKLESAVGPDLGGYTTETPAELMDFLQREVEREGSKHKKEFKGSDEELTSILEWLGGLEPAAAEDP